MGTFNSDRFRQSSGDRGDERYGGRGPAGRGGQDGARGHEQDANRMPMSGRERGDLYGGGRSPRSTGSPHRSGGHDWQGSLGERGQMPDAFGRSVSGSGSREASGRASHAGKGPKSYQRSDERIREQVCDALTDSHEVDATDIEVTVKDGEVTLSGQVSDRDAKRMAEDRVWQIASIKDVTNHLKVARSGAATGNTSEAESATDSGASKART